MFRGPHPFSRGDEEFFFGREADLDTLAGRLTNSRFRLGVLEGSSGVGKTSLVLAGLSKHFGQIQDAPLLLYVDANRGLKDQLSRSIDELSGETEDNDDPMARLPSLMSALQRRLIVVIDHIDMVLVGREPEWEVDRKLLSRLSQGAVSGTMPGLLLVVDRRHFALLADLLGRFKIGIPPRMLVRLEPFPMEEVRAFVEQAALASGRYLETGMAALIAQDVAAFRPLLPMDLQVLMAGIFETNRPTARRYLSAGGGRHIMADWVEEACRKAGGAQAMELLSLLADEAEEGTTWVTASRLSALTGLPEDRAAPIIASLADSGLLASWENRCRLASHALIRLVRRVDGKLRFQRRRADRILERRSGGRMPLLPQELPEVLPFAKTQQHRTMVKRSAMVWGAAIAFLLLALTGVFTAIQVAAVRRRSLDISDRHRPDATVVLRKGGGSLPNWAILPTSPAFGALLFDTAIPASALARPLSRPKLVKTAGKASRPGWFSEVLELVTTTRRMEFELLSNPANSKLWRRLANKASGIPPSRLLDLVGLVGHGGKTEMAILSSGLAEGGASAKRAIRAALAIAARDDEIVVPLGPRSHEAPGISAKDLERAFSRMPPCRALRAAWVVGRPTRSLLWDLARMKGCGTMLPKIASLAVGMRDPILAARGFQVLATTTKGDVTAMAIDLLEALPRVVDKQRVTNLVAFLNPQLKGRRLSPDALSALKKLARRSANPETAQAVASILTRLGQAPLETAEGLAGSKAVTDRLRAAALCRGIFSIRPGNLPSSMEKLLEDSDESVQVAALSCLEHVTNPDPGLLLRLVTGRNPKARAGAMFPFALTKAFAPDPYKVARFLYLNAKSGPPGLAGAAARAAAHLVRRPSHWDVAKFFVFPVTHAPRVEDRMLAATAVLDLLDVNAASALKYLERLAADSEPKVQLAVISAIEALTAGERRANASGLTRVLARLAQGANRQVAQAAVWALLDPHMGNEGRLRLAEVAPHVLAGGGRPAAMMAMLWPLGQANDAKAIEGALVQALQSAGDALDASLVLKRLAERGSAKAWNAVVQASSKPLTAAPAVRIACRKGPQSLAAVRKALGTRSNAARQAALECLMAQTRGWTDDSLRRACESLASSSGPLRASALGAMATCPSCRSRVMSRIHTLARSALTGDRVTAAEAVWHLGSEAEKVLTGLVTDPSLEVRRAATLGLARVWSGERSPLELAGILRDSRIHRGKRHAAILALCLHADKAASRKAIESLRSAHNPILQTLAKSALANACVLDQDGEPALARLIDLVFLY